MKCSKRLFIFVLCVVLIVPVLSLPVYAQDKILIESVDITVKEDLQGIPLSNYDEYITINSPGLKLIEKEGIPSVGAFSTFGKWEYDSLETGNVYYLYMYFEPEDGYAFPEGVRLDDVKINGEKPEDWFHVYWFNEETGEVYLELGYTVEMIGDDFFSQLLFFIKTLIYDISPSLFDWIF